MKPSDHELMQGIVNRDQDALSALYGRYSGAMFARIMRVVRIEVIGEEVLQDVFIEVWNKADKYMPDQGRVSTWLLTLARNRAIDRLRKRARRDELSDDYAESRLVADMAAPDDAASARQEASEVREALRSLPDEQRIVIEKCYFSGLTVQEAAAELELPLGTVKTRLRLGMKKLRSVFVEEAA